MQQQVAVTETVLQKDFSLVKRIRCKSDTKKPTCLSKFYAPHHM